MSLVILMIIILITKMLSLVGGVLNDNDNDNDNDCLLYTSDAADE